MFRRTRNILPNYDETSEKKQVENDDNYIENDFIYKYNKEVNPFSGNRIIEISKFNQILKDVCIHINMC